MIEANTTAAAVHSVPESKKSALFASAEAERAFLADYREGRPFGFELSSAGALHLLAEARSVPPEVWFDRASRRIPRHTLVAWPRRPGETIRSGRSPCWAARSYREKDHGVEIVAAGPDGTVLTRLHANLVSALNTPIDSGQRSTLLLPAGVAGEVASGEHDLFLVVLAGAGRFERADGAVGWQPGSGLFVPPGQQCRIVVEAEALILQTRVVPLTAAHIVGRYLVRRVLGGDRVARRARGLIHELEGEVAPPDSLAELETAVALYRDEIGRMVDGQYAEIAAKPPPTPGLAMTPGAATMRDDRVALYDEDTWEAKALIRRPKDIFITTYKRSGTTWLQMILYQLLTDGDLDKIAHIYEFAPYAGFEMQITGSVDRVERLPDPRVLKTHLSFENAYSSVGRYIHVARDGMDVAVSSYFQHLEVESRHVPFDIYFDRFLTEPNGWFDHVRGWWQNRERPNILFLTYRSLKVDLPGTIRRIAAFCGLPLDEERLNRTVERSSFVFMKANEAKFHHNEGVRWLRSTVRQPGFIRNGAISEGRERLDGEQRRRFSETYAAKLGDTGLQLDH